MKTTTLFITLIATVLSLSFINPDIQKEKKNNTNMSIENDSVLRHVVLFKFKEGTAVEKIKIVEEAFNALPSKIPQIKSLEWGLNNSPEGLNKGFTHCYFLTFTSEEDRAIYLPHPDHKAFGATLDGILDDVLVVDYWSTN
ncbi:MAG: stress responsive alpha-beta barrel domain-containing protein [Flavobacteriaceae bacterium]|nr:MAG: stress responsive alpha-beta barrel domain-containing protein [Flavobacteriaceae bacterium]